MRPPGRKSTGSAQCAQDRVADAAYIPEGACAAISASVFVMRSVALHLLQESIGRQINRHINAGSNCLNLNEAFAIKLEAAPATN
jgi:hypothetical protein